MNIVNRGMTHNTHRFHRQIKLKKLKLRLSSKTAIGGQS